MGPQLAVLNVARMKAPLDAALMAGFVAQLATLNALADAAPGFVWRMIEEDPEDPALKSLGLLPLVNMSVWADVAALRDFVYHSSHAGILRRRGDWFESAPVANAVLWWVPDGHIPTLAEAVERLSHLRACGPSASAFTFRSAFDPA